MVRVLAGSYNGRIVIKHVGDMGRTALGVPTRKDDVNELHNKAEGNWPQNLRISRRKERHLPDISL